MELTDVFSFAVGFPSPADDYLERELDLNEYLISNPAATFFLRAQGESMIEAGIHPGDVLIVDRSLEACHGQIVIAVVNGEFLLKKFVFQSGKIWLIAECPGYPPLEIISDTGFEIWGVVIHVIHSFRVKGI
jgi:DNA polymerase V